LFELVGIQAQGVSHCCEAKQEELACCGVQDLAKAAKDALAHAQDLLGGSPPEHQQKHRRLLQDFAGILQVGSIYVMLRPAAAIRGYDYK
jgi:hypothetical protein